MGYIDDAVNRLGKASTRLGSATPRQRKSFSEEKLLISETLERLNKSEASQNGNAVSSGDKPRALPDAVFETAKETPEHHATPF